MPAWNIGVDCEVILDGQGYFVEPHSYARQQPRVRRAAITKGGGERYVDTGPGKHVWVFVVLAVNQLLRYDGQPVGLSGEQYRDALLASYAKVATTLGFTDPHGVAWTVHFDNYTEEIRDIRTQLVSPSYLCRVELVEA